MYVCRMHETHSYPYSYAYGQTANSSRKGENDGEKKWGKKAVKYRLFIYTQL